MGLVVNRENWKDWFLVVGIVSSLTLGIWWLVYLNVGHDEEGDGDMIMEEEHKEIIVSGLKDGKDYSTDYAENEEAEFEVLVVLRDQQYDDPEENRRSALKRGDVLAVRKLPHVWSGTERASYLIVRIRMTGKEADALIVPKKDGEMIVSARAQHIDLDQIGFSGSQVTSNQPFGGKTFGTNIMKEKI